MPFCVQALWLIANSSEALPPQASELFELSEILCYAECLIQLCELLLHPDEYAVQLCELLLHPLFSRDQHHAAFYLQLWNDIDWQVIDRLRYCTEHA